MAPTAPVTPGPPAVFTSTDVSLLLVDLVLILVLARLLGGLARRFGQPAVVGEVLAGILLGKTLFHGAIPRHLVPADLSFPLTSLADLGLVLFMFIVGYEIDLNVIRGRERTAMSVSLGSIAVPMVGGSFLGVWLAHREHVTRVLPFALFIGAAMSITAFPVLARLLTDRQLHKTRIGSLALSSGAVDDVIAWALLAVVVTIGGTPKGRSHEWHILLAPVYLALMWFVIRPLMKMVSQRYRDRQRLSPDQLAVVLAALLLSAATTEWLNVHFIFGAFICGAVMPRADGAAVREAILERLEQLSVLLLLPVFFVIAGLSVDLSALDAHDLVDIVAILGVAIGGKFLGAYLGARSAGVRKRQASMLATLMNTRGLTELIILTVGMQNQIISAHVFTLMVVMAVVTTAMTGPLLRVVYPPRLVERDIADAARAELPDAAYRVLVVLPTDDPDPVRDAALVDIAIDLAAARGPGVAAIARLLPQRRAGRLEVGSGLSGGLTAMTSGMAELHALAARGKAKGVRVGVFSQFSEDIEADLTRYILDADPDLVLLTPSVQLADHTLMPRTISLTALPAATPLAIEVALGSEPDHEVALQAGTQLAAVRNLPLVLTDGSGRRERAVLAELARHGIRAELGAPRDDALVIATEPSERAHLVARARRDDELQGIDEWAVLVSAGRQS